MFTDIDCGYCRKLHSQIAEYNRLGIRVRYLFYPRSGPDTESWAKAEQVWCSKDRNDAFTRLSGARTSRAASSAKARPVARDYALGQKLDIGGTPAHRRSKTASCSPGYLPPAMLAQHLRGELRQKAGCSGDPNFSSRASFPACLPIPWHPAAAAFFSVITGHCLASSAFSGLNVLLARRQLLLG